MGKDKPRGWTGFFMRKLVESDAREDRVADKALAILEEQNARLLEMQEADARFKRRAILVGVFALVLILVATLGIGSGTISIPGLGSISTHPVETSP